MNNHEIISRLPYRKPFLFVDEITEISDKGIVGNYTFREDEYFYPGHFINNPITPGVILTEVMAQIGVVCLGIKLMGIQAYEKHSMVLTSSNIEFLEVVKPKERVTVMSEIIYFRFGKLKCQVSLYNEMEKKVCNGILAGMIIKEPK